MAANGKSVQSEVLEGQAKMVLQALEGRKHPKTSPIYGKATEWIRNWPTELNDALRRQLLKTICSSFDVKEADVLLDVAGAAPPRVKAASDPEAELRAVLPKDGWFAWYDKFTQQTESPLSYHIFSSLVVLGCAMGRRVWMDMGFFKVWPNFTSVLIGPTGKVRKTSATDIAKEFIHKAVLCPIMADKITPESLASALRESGHHFIYAPEFAVLFGKQKYNEGLTTLVIRLLDSPDQWVVRTQGRGEEVVTNLALNILGCSTLSLLATAAPQEVTSSGFLNRFVLVTEEDTSREFESPIRGADELEQKLYATLAFVKGLSGVVSTAPQALAFRKEWYHSRWKKLREIENETAAEVIQRGDMHMRRIAMLTHLSHCGDMQICDKCMKVAAGMIAYTEKRIPQMMELLKQNSNNGGGDVELVYRTLLRLGGAADHSTLLRRVSSQMSASKLKGHISTLEESGRVKIGTQGGARFYTVSEE